MGTRRNLFHRQHCKFSVIKSSLYTFNRMLKCLKTYLLRSLYLSISTSCHLVALVHSKAGISTDFFCYFLNIFQHCNFNRWCFLKISAKCTNTLQQKFFPKSTFKNTLRRPCSTLFSPTGQPQLRLQLRRQRPSNRRQQSPERGPRRGRGQGLLLAIGARRHRSGGRLRRRPRQRIQRSRQENRPRRPPATYRRSHHPKANPPASPNRTYPYKRTMGRQPPRTWKLERSRFGGTRTQRYRPGRTRS